jgi:hypothetical protein
MLKRILLALGLMTSLTLVALLGRGRVRTAEELAPPPRADLNPWDLVGCYELRVDPWEVEAFEAAPDSVTLAPPARVMLMPDSVDAWGRAQSTRRAVPLGGEPDDPLASILRWFTRVDTLWLLWSDGTTRAGVALFDDGDNLVGRARSFSAADSSDVTAPAAAWRINCATLDRESPGRRPRR